VSIIASYVLQGGRAEPYVTLDEVKFSPTASAIDFTNLIENGSQQVQDRALYELIIRASAKADNYCMGPYGSLNATVNTENGRYLPNRRGEIIIHPYFSPLLEVVSFEAGWGPGQGMSNIPLNTSNCSIERNQFIITPQGPLGLQFGGLGIAGGWWSYNSEFYCQYTYVNGWANSFTTTTTAAGATSVTVGDATGIYAGQNLTIWDGMNDEYVQVANTYDNTSLVIPLAAPLKYRHGSGVNISALPATVKQAVIHLVVALIKQRGDGGLVLNEIGEPTAATSTTVTSMHDEILAYDLLDDFKVVWSRT